MEIHQHSHGGHPHTHGSINGSIIQNKEATRVLFISLAGLTITAIFQAIIVAISGSTSLLADTIHNFGDALTSIPLWIAFVLSRRKPTTRFTYGYNRSEDLAGFFILLVIFISAVLAGYESIRRLVEGSTMTHLSVTAIAAIVGFLGNELVAVYRIRMGKKLGSAALIADGHHARIDGWTSLAVLIGVISTWFGFPIIDPVIGLVITIIILFILKDSAKTILTRLLDGIEPQYIEQIKKSASEVEGVHRVYDVKARWFGHEIIAELSVALDSKLTIKEGHEVAKQVNHALQHEIDHLTSVQIHVDPLEEQGSAFHAHEHFHHDHHEEGEHSHHEHEHHYHIHHHAQ